MTTIDNEVFRSINNLAGRNDVLDYLGIFISKYTIFILAAFLIFQWFYKRQDSSYRKVLILSLLTFIVAEILAKGLGQLYEHLQPFAVLPNVNQLIEKEVNNSFPSDHTVLFFSILTPLFLYSGRKGKVLCFFSALLVGISRIFVGVHYPSDVVAGGLLAIAVGILIYRSLFSSKIMNQLVAFIEKLETKLLSR
ncbi:undecaprenyl-diphosphatase [Enterococcus sp. LJL128]